MKRSILLLAVIFSCLTAALADNILLLTHPTSRETNVFRKGSYLVFELKADQSKHEGYIRAITDSSIVFDDSQVSLSQIHVLAGTTKAKLAARHVANTIGNSLLYAGLTVFDCGINLILYDDYYYWPIGGTIWAAGAVIAGLGYAFDWAVCPPAHSIRVRNYSQWHASILTEGQPVAEEQKVLPKDTVPAQPVPVESPKKKKNKITEDDVYGG